MVCYRVDFLHQRRLFARSAFCYHLPRFATKECTAGINRDGYSSKAWATVAFDKTVPYFYLLGFTIAASRLTQTSWRMSESLSGKKAGELCFAIRFR
jgi:hypothetical protein